MAFNKTGTPQPMQIMKTGKCEVCHKNEAHEDSEGKKVCSSCKPKES